MAGEESKVVRGGMPFAKKAAENVRAVIDTEIAPVNLFDVDAFKVTLALQPEHRLNETAKKFQAMPRTFANQHLSVMGVSSMEELRKKYAGLPQSLKEMEDAHLKSLSKPITISADLVFDFVLPMPGC